MLDKQVPVYHRFVDNQVLTNDQLNEVLDHINFQDKLTRTGLVGVGIVCGLELQTTATTINLGRGIAVTTDGDLLKKDDTIYRGFKAFKDEQVKYGHFLENDKTLELYELEENTAPSDVLALSQFMARTGIAKDRMVALLYLENFLKEEEDCSPIDCDAQGREVAYNLRVLVTSIDAAKKIAEKDSIFNGLLTSTENDVLNKIDKYLPKRVVVNSGNTAAIGNLKNSYAVQFDGLFNRIVQLGEMSIFRSLSNASGLDLTRPITKLNAHDLNFQYVYDFYKDLATAYNELLIAVREQYTLCCPDALAFPKHVLLGEVFNSPTYLRHRFYPSPLHNDRRPLEHLRQLFMRIMQMIKHFLVTSQNDLRITPSKNSDHPLGQRALPFYYNLSKANDFREMLASWQIGSNESPLNYYKAGYPSSNFEPLDYCLDGHDFYRIEGHVGQEVTEVVKDLQNKRTQKGLAFDIMPIAIGVAADEATLDYEKYNMHFEDLQVILQAWNEEQKCLISSSSKFLTRFSAVDKGLHLDYGILATATPVTPVNPVDLSATVSAAEILRAAQPMSFTNFRVAGSATAAVFAGQKMAKSKTNTVLDTMDKSEGSLGGLYVKDILASDGGSDFQVKIEGVLKDVIKDWEQEFQVAVAKIPSNLLGKLKVSEDNKLIDIEDFTEANLLKYIDALNAQCKSAQQAKKDLQAQVSKANSGLKDAAYLENYFFVLNRIIASCCLVERVKVLYEKILERKKELLEKMVLKEYVKAHPGAEHKAGVERGGTFVVLYYSNLKPENTGGLKPGTFDFSALDLLAPNPGVFTSRPNLGSVFDTALGRGNTTIPAFTKASIEADLMARKGINFAELARFDNRFADLVNLGKFGNLPSDLTGRTTFNVAHGTVIGDLCLPYICCTDMPATTFVYPDQEVSLFIGKDHVCVPFEGDGAQVLLQVKPADGIVTAQTGDTALPDVIIKKDNNFFFEPNTVPENLFGRTIRFKVNGQNVAEELRVLRQPKASFAISEKVTFRNEGTVAEIILKNTSQSIAGQTFIWDFGQGEIVAQDAIEFKHTYKVNPGSTFSFEIILKAENSSCSDTAKDKKVIVVPSSDGDSGNCEKETVATINGGRTAINTDLAEHPSELKEIQVFYKNEMEPLYELLFKDVSATLEGNFDTDIFGILLKNQKAIDERLTVNLTLKEQEFLLRLYYEKMLLYFYVQRCREGSIAARAKITGDWDRFTTNAADSFKEALRSLLKNYPVSEKLGQVRTEMDARLSKPLKNVLEIVLKRLKN